MANAVVLTEVDRRGVATVTLNRPEVNNAYNGDMILGLIEAFGKLGADSGVRVVVIRGNGRHFQAAADLKWIQSISKLSPDENLQVSMNTTNAIRGLNEFPKPTFALVHGACFGGGCGVVCCVDVALATPEAIFGLTEVRVGVAPTPISTHMVHAMGLRHTRRYALTGERFGAEEALRIGLVHEVVEADKADARLAEIIDQTMLSSPSAIAMTKDSFLGANGLKLSAREMSLLAHESWMQRASAEGREGLAAFREKRRPAWYR